MGFNSVGLSTFRQNILAYRSKTKGFPVFANIGKNRETTLENASEDYRACFEALHDCVDGFVVNLSSPNTPGLVQLQSEAFLEQIASQAPIGKPVWIKLSPDLDNGDITRLGEWVAREERITGIVLTNTSREMAEEVFGWDRGGLSGRLLFSRALECVTLARQAVGPKKMVVGVGGIWNAEGARQMRRAGADLIEVYTAFVYQGPKLLRALSQLD
jgi:dihydroorotate dehydrogenase